jgi:hypothetical protein
MRYRPGHMFAKKAGAGFVGEALPLCRIAGWDLNHDPPPCFICQELECVEWANCEVLDPELQVVGYIHHVSECEMADA